MDHVICAFMAERNIGYLICFGNILHSNSQRRTRLFGRISQNIMLCRKYKVKVVLSSGARTVWDVKNPWDLAIMSRFLGMSDGESMAAVSKNTLHFVKKASERNSQNILLSGLEVKDWGSHERKPKQKYGWY